jgi:phage terminase large subunit
MPNENISLEYKPRPWQQKFHTSAAQKRFALAIVARQHGKTELAVMELIHRALHGPKGVNYGYVCPFAHQTRKVFWPRLKKLLGPLHKYVSYRETDMICTLPNGAKLYGLGGDNEGARGLTLRGMVIDEFDDLSTEVYQAVLLPTMTSFGDDAFTLFIGTLKQNGKLWELYRTRQDDPGWYVQVTKATEAGLMTDEQLDRYRLEMGDTAFMREFLCDPDAPVSNSVVGDLITQAELSGRIPPSLPLQGVGDVHTAWDLGLRDQTSIWFFQLAGHSIHVIDYQEFAGIGLVEIGNRVRKLYRNYGSAILPHDIAIRDYSTGISRLQTFRDLNIGRPEPLKRAPVEDGLNATRLNIPRCVFAQDKCRDGLSRLRQARYAVDTKTGTVLDKVVHDDSSHALDSFRYLCSWVERKHPSTGPRAGQSMTSQFRQVPKVNRTIRPRRAATYG